jgi:solute:Na+ symporter, SSS family
MTGAPLAAFGPIDWGIVAAYLGLMLVIGIVAARREKRAKSDTADYFLGGRSLPIWALAISIVASSLSAATFVGVPDRAYNGDLTYLILNVGGFIAVFVVGLLFVPRLYRAGTITIYGFLANRFGETARTAVSMTFLLGRMLASGARLMLAAVPLCMLMYNIPFSQVTPAQKITAILLIGFFGTFYTTFGGIRTVVWVDVIQFALVVGAALMTIALLLSRIPAPISKIAHVLDERHKLKLWNASTDPADPFTIWTALGGAMLVNVAAFGVDQDLAQRFLVAKSATRGALSVIASQFVSVAVVSLFLIIGLLLYVFYQRPDVMGSHGAIGYAAPGPNEAAYQLFLLKEMPPIASGLAIAGLFAVAQGSMDSAINALASSLVADIYLPLRRRFGRPIDEHKPIDAPKWAVAAMGAVMTLFAIACIIAYDPKTKAFLDFALSVLNFAFSGMLAVFLTALLTKRGNSMTVVLALLSGIAVVTLTQDWAFKRITHALIGVEHTIAFTWAMPLATGAAFLVCVAGKPARREVRS